MNTHALLRAACAAAVAVTMAACGGGDDGEPVLTGETARDSRLTQPQTVITLSAEDINAVVRTLGVRELTCRPCCDVRIVPIEYNTVGVAGEATLASGALLVPAGACAEEQHLLPAYGRGTTVEKPRTMAGPDQTETLLLSAFYAVVQPPWCLAEARRLFEAAR